MLGSLIYPASQPQSRALRDVNRRFGLRASLSARTSAVVSSLVASCVSGDRSRAGRTRQVEPCTGVAAAQQSMRVAAVPLT